MKNLKNLTDEEICCLTLLKESGIMGEELAGLYMILSKEVDLNLTRELIIWAENVYPTKDEMTEAVMLAFSETQKMKNL